MLRPLRLIIDAIVKHGELRLTDAGGESHRFGDGGEPQVAIRLADRRLERQLILDPSLALGEAYMDGRLVLEQGSIYDLLHLLLSNLSRRRWPAWLRVPERLRLATKRLRQFNPPWRARRNAAHHYDIDGAIYDLFLDRDWQYSCAYFEREGQSLDDAQLAKKRHLASKLMLRDGLRVLDIGSGWGGLALYLAQTAGVKVTGVTLSEEQLKMSRMRSRKEGLANVVDFELLDYRQVKGRFDRIVSVGMFEHVGVTHYRAFFDTVYRLLADDGVALLHAIGRFDGPATTNPFIEKYIFPGGYIPALSEVLPAIERSGLLVTDIEILRLHYAETLRHWRQRFRANWQAAARIRDERFCRMWEFYLAGSEAAFRFQNLMVFQIQLAKRQEALPLTRDYMFTAERRLRERDVYGEIPRMAGE